VLYARKEVMKERMKDSTKPQKAPKMQELLKLVHEASIHLEDNKFTLPMILQAMQSYYSFRQHRRSMTKDKFQQKKTPEDIKSHTQQANIFGRMVGRANISVNDKTVRCANECKKTHEEAVRQPSSAGWNHVTTNGISENNHVEMTMRYIQMVKEQGQSTYNTLPFQKSPARLIVAMVFATIYWLNTLHPINFGPHAGVDINNNEDDNDVTVMEAAGVAAQPIVAPEMVRSEIKVAAGVAAPATEVAARVAEDQATGVAEDQATGVAEDQATGVAEDQATGVAEDQAAGVAEDQAAEVAEMVAPITAATGVAENDNDNNTSNVGIPADMDHLHGEREHQYGLRLYKPRSYGHLHHSLGDILNQKLKPQQPKDSKHLHNTLHGTILTQYMMKKGLEMFSWTGEEALSQEPPTTTLLAAKPFDYDKHCEMECGGCPEIHELHKNPMHTRTSVILASRLTEYAPGGNGISKLNTSNIIKRVRPTSLLMPTEPNAKDNIDKIYQLEEDMATNDDNDETYQLEEDMATNDDNLDCNQLAHALEIETKITGMIELKIEPKIAGVNADNNSES